ncbi:MAG TPA: universal stress protein [Solirubrobacter sp.]|nr:universal stress protein [Solirubrobacter sp.]
MTRLLIADDGSDAARAATAVAAELYPGATAVVATVHAPAPTLESAAIARVALPDAMIREGVERMQAEAGDAARATAEAGAERARAAGLDATPRVLAHPSAWRALRAEAADGDADVLVCGTRGPGPLERTLIGSTASSLLHHAERPLLVVPAGGQALEGPVVAGYDESDGARAALRFAAGHLAARPLIVATGWRSPTRHSLRGHALARSGVETLEDYAQTVDTIWREVAADRAEDGAAYARDLGLDARAAVPESGHGEWQALLAGAQDAGAAAILVGSRGRGAITSTVLGSVASGLVHAAALPVIVVPSVGA